MVNINIIIRKLLNFKLGSKIDLSMKEIFDICNTVLPIFKKQPMLIEISSPVNICGDIHGQYHDLLRIFNKCGVPPKTNYIFLGDYVDRGDNSLEVICLLFAFKIKYPENFFPLRGNHESESINKVYGFLDECKQRYGAQNGTKIWKNFGKVFNWMPVAGLIAGRIFCCHGGISPDLHTPYDINKIKRPTEIPDEGLLCDVLWSDPEAGENGWGENDRGVSYTFGKDKIDEFLDNNDLDLIARAHQVVEDGYEFFNNRKLVTIFSAPNYCGEFDNAGGVMQVDENLRCSFQIIHPFNKEKSNFISCAGRPCTPPPS